MWYDPDYGSNYGQTTVDLGAPGPGILTCRWGGGYDYIDKKSAATAHVSGACALLWSVNPALSHLHLKQILLANVDKISALSPYCVTGGRLNIYKAVACADAVGVPVFNVKNGSGEIVAWFDDLGNLILLGTLTQNTTPSPSPDKDEFRVQNATDVAMIDTTNGNMTIQGSLHEQQGPLQNPASDDFIIKDSNGNIVAYINSSGDLYLKAKLYKSQ